jgi:exopolyphosphatase/guanosine-5'-triphosphate,3'-diphosphate pyrophosphatase
VAPARVARPGTRSSDTLAAIDIGTNSIHLVVARVRGRRSFEVIDREREMVRLGSGAGDMKHLEPDAIDRGIAALARFREIAQSSRAPVAAVATSAVREAENAGEFLRRAWREAGVRVEVISGVEEARLIRLGVLQSLPIYDRPHLVIDIGGGSTEIVIGRRDEDLFARSLRLGAIRLTDRFFPRGRAGRGSLEACRKFVRAALVSVARDAGPFRFDVAAGSAGTIQAVAAVARAARGNGSPPKTYNGFLLGRAEVVAAVKRLAKAATVAERRRVPGLDAKRADIILAGAVILEQALLELEVESILVSEYGLREGVLLDAYERHHGSARHHLHDVRRRSVSHLAELCDSDLPHSAEGARLALGLFDALRRWHGLDDGERELLEAAALLANVGLVISHSQHHRHSYYVIRNSDHLAGFTDHEIEIIAQVARYHRKSAPRGKHLEFGALPLPDQQTIRALAAILRLAVGLNRPRGARIGKISCRAQGQRLIVEVEPSGKADLSLGLYTATERSSLLEEVLGRRIEVRTRKSRRG